MPDSVKEALGTSVYCRRSATPSSLRKVPILMIRTEDTTCPKKRSRSHFNDTNGRYDVRKSDLEVILVLRTRRYYVRKSELKVILMIRTKDTTYEKAI